MQIEENVYVTIWFDKRGANIISSIVPPSMETAQRWNNDKRTGAVARLTVERPNLIRWYNGAMGGTDSFDQRLSYYRTGVRSKKWHNRVIFHFLLCSVINSHILYKN
jgi:hypothetical protein